MADTKIKSITEWYEGRSVLVTGGTGFMGKVLLEKLIRALPGLKKVYILLRTKRGVSPVERIKVITMLPIFEKLREVDPDVLKKLIAVDGDVALEGLGVSPAVFKRLQEDVSVVFHNAATLRLEAGIKDAVSVNTVGTKNVMELCTKLPKIEAVIHMSTAFCHGDIESLDEKVYDSPHDPEDIMHMIKALDATAVEKITPQILGPHPNSYTFSKRLAEVIADRYSDRLPVVIARPSIVIPALQEPLPGWVDSLNGPIGIIVGAGKGVIRSMMVEPESHAEVIPVDVAINGMIAFAWHRATHNFETTPVFNLTTSELIHITWAEVIEKGKKIGREYPFNGPVIWYPDGNIRTNRFTHMLMCFFFHFLPAYLIDFLMLIFFQPRFMVHVYNKVHVGLEVLKYFTMRDWKFDNKKFLAIANDISPEDLEKFYMANAKWDIEEYLLTIILGTRQYCLKEDLSTIPRARKLHMWLYVLDRVAKLCFFLGIGYLILRMFYSSQSVSQDQWSLGVEKQTIQGVSFM